MRPISVAGSVAKAHGAARTVAQSLKVRFSSHYIAFLFLNFQGVSQPAILATANRWPLMKRCIKYSLNKSTGHRPTGVCAKTAGKTLFFFSGPAPQSGRSC